MGHWHRQTWNDAGNLGTFRMIAPPQPEVVKLLLAVARRRGGLPAEVTDARLRVLQSSKFEERTVGSVS